METLQTLLQWEFGFLLGGLAAIVFYQMLTGGINTDGLFLEKNGAGDYSWGRVQLLFFTFIFAFIYIGKVMQDPTHLPDIRPEFLALLGGSNLAYLGQKTYHLLQELLKMRGLPEG